MGTPASRSAAGRVRWRSNFKYWPALESGAKKDSRCWFGHIDVPVDKNVLPIFCNATISLVSGVRLPGKIREVAGRHCHIRHE